MGGIARRVKMWVKQFLLQDPLNDGGLQTVEIRPKS